MKKKQSKKEHKIGPGEGKNISLVVLGPYS